MNNRSSIPYLDKTVCHNPHLIILALPPAAPAELTERLVESLAQDISFDITKAQLVEVRLRIAQVESGQVELIPGDEALARVRYLLAPHLPRR